METMQFHITKMDSFLGMDLSNCITDEIYNNNEPRSVKTGLNDI